MTAKVPGALNVDADGLASDMIVPLAVTSPRSAQTTLGDMAQFFELSNDVQNTAITTVGAGTLTAAALVGGLITRTGSTAAYTDTTATGAEILAAWGADTPVGATRLVTIKNMVAFTQTLAGGTDVTLAGLTVIAGLSVGTFLLKQEAAGVFTLTGISVTPLMNLPNAKFVTAALESATIAAASVAGANVCEHINTGTTPGNLQFPTASDLVAAIPNAQVGFAYILEIRNGSGSANTATITTNTGITLTGTMTIAQNVTRRFIVTLTSLTAVTVQSMGISAAAA
jgi:hypothetical protein